MGESMQGMLLLSTCQAQRSVSGLSLTMTSSRGKGLVLTECAWFNGFFPRPGLITEMASPSVQKIYSQNQNSLLSFNFHQVSLSTIDSCLTTQLPVVPLSKLEPATH